jgi:hypothetical protein
MPSSTGHDIIDDIKDLFLFLSRDTLCFKTESGSLFGIDPTSLAVAGSSAGGMCAYLAAIHASPKPKAVLSMYGMGGQLFVSYSIFPLWKIGVSGPYKRSRKHFLASRNSKAPFNSPVSGGQKQKVLGTPENVTKTHGFGMDPETSIPPECLPFEPY